MTRQQYQELLELKEERISNWEQYGCILSTDGRTCEFAYPEAEL